jgi:hypothetical protein
MESPAAYAGNRTFLPVSTSWRRAARSSGVLPFSERPHWRHVNSCEPHMSMNISPPQEGQPFRHHLPLILAICHLQLRFDLSTNFTSTMAIIAAGQKTSYDLSHTKSAI